MPKQTRVTGEGIAKDLRRLAKGSCKACHGTGYYGAVIHTAADGQRYRERLACTCIHKHPDFAATAAEWQRAIL